MQISFNQLRAQYRNLSNEKLIEIYKGGGLTETAAAVLKEEMSARGLTETKIESLLKAQHENKELEYQSTDPKRKGYVGHIGLTLLIMFVIYLLLLLIGMDESLMKKLRLLFICISAGIAYIILKNR